MAEIPRISTVAERQKCVLDKDIPTKPTNEFKDTLNRKLVQQETEVRLFETRVFSGRGRVAAAFVAVSYTHLTLPTILLV